MNNTKLIVGLGNPGTKYLNTRHNIGYRVIDKLAQFFKIKSSETEEDYEFAVKEYKDFTVVLMKPLTFMNRSGFAVREFFENYEIYGDNVLIVFDDVNLDFGTLRLRPSGTDGGHKGMQSIIYDMHTEEIPRLRIGIKNEEELKKYLLESAPAQVIEKTDDGEEIIIEKPTSKYDLAEYVLSNFTEYESKEMDKVLESAKDAVMSFIEKGIAETMNLYNKKVLE